MPKTSVMVAWSFELYLYLELTVPQVSDCCPLRRLVYPAIGLFIRSWPLTSKAVRRRPRASSWSLSFTLFKHLLKDNSLSKLDFMRSLNGSGLLVSFVAVRYRQKFPSRG